MRYAFLTAMLLFSFCISAAEYRIDSESVKVTAPTSSTYSAWQYDANSFFRDSFDLFTVKTGLDSKEKYGSRTTQLILFNSVAFIVNRCFSITVHDLAHLERADSLGATESYIKDESTGKRMTPFQLFIRSFNFTHTSAVAYYTIPDFTAKDVAAVSGEGLNSNLLLSAQTAQRIYLGQGHIMDISPYFANKLWGIFYFLQAGKVTDAKQYVTSIRAQGYHSISKNRIVAAASASCLLSGGTANIVHGAAKYITDANAFITPLYAGNENCAIGIPEFTTCLNQDNVSIMSIVDLKLFDAQYFWMGADTPAFGNRQADNAAIAGSKVYIGRFSPLIELTWAFHGFPFIKSGIDLAINSTISCGVEAAYGRKTTQREFREYPRGNGAIIFASAKL